MGEEKKAKQRIIDAYLDILQTKRYDRITVAAVVRKAGINRSTFYRNFLDIQDLYETICDETSERIVNEVCDRMKALFGKGLYPEQLQRGYEAVYEVFAQNKTVISLLSGSKGSLTLVKRFRDKSIERISSLLPVFDKSDDLRYQAGLLADVSVLFVYTMYSFRTGEDLLRLREVLPDTTLKKDFMTNILTVNDILSEERSCVEYKLLMATYEAWRQKGTIDLTVSDITQRAGISRTEFYLYHKNIAEFYANFENIATYVLSKFVLEMALTDYERLHTIQFNMKELSESLGSFIGSIDHMSLFTFLFRTCTAMTEKYFQILKRENGEASYSGKEYHLMFYLCGIIVAVVRYAVSGDEQRFLRTMATADNFKKIMDKTTEAF